MQDQSKAPGKFITVEGQDGAGKTTNLDFMESCLSDRGLSVVRTREPGGTELGEAIRKLLLDTNNVSLCSMAELLLIFAARAQHLDEVIRPTLEIGKWVLCDRFTDATFAYQGGGRRLSGKDISLLETLVQGSLRPDLTVLLDLDVGTGSQRTRSRGEPDRFEIEEDQFKMRVRESYRKIALNAPERVKIVDASCSLADVQGSLDEILTDFIHG